MATGIKRVDHHEAKPSMLDLVLDVAILVDGNLGQHFAKAVATVVIADRPQQGPLPSLDQRFHVAVSAFVVAMLDQIAADDQQVGLGAHLVDMVDNHIQPPDIELVRIVGVEADVEVGDLRDQHGAAAVDKLESNSSPRRPVA